MLDTRRLQAACQYQSGLDVGRANKEYDFTHNKRNDAASYVVEKIEKEVLWDSGRIIGIFTASATTKESQKIDIAHAL